MKYLILNRFWNNFARKWLQNLSQNGYGADDDDDHDDDDKETYFKRIRNQICRSFYRRRYSYANLTIPDKCRKD